jgi:hypothetical protein
MACDPSKKCPICDQKGLPILPVRYEVSRVQSVKRLPMQLSAPFSASQIKLPPNYARYTLRLLRAGYLYVFNERRQHWSGYVVSDDAHLVEYDLRAPAPKLGDAQPCSRMAASQTGRYLVIPDASHPELLGKIWLAFSSAAWTDEILKQHQSADYRRRHMRSIDVAAWAKGGGAQPHMDTIYAAKDKVAEFHLASDYSIANKSGLLGPQTLPTVTVSASGPAFSHSLTDMLSFDKGRVDALVATMRQVAGQLSPDSQGIDPAVVAIDDPVGLIADLNQLILEESIVWAEQPERKEKRESALAITALREAIKNGAVESEEAARKDRAMIGQSVMQTLFGRAHTTQFTRPVQEWDDDWFKVEDEDEILRLGAESWEKYQKHLKGGKAYEDYLKNTYVNELKQLGEQVITPLDEAYVAWLECDTFKQHMICSFDAANTRSGMQYQESVMAIISDALGRMKVFDYATNALQQDPAKQESILSRAMVWNLDGAIKQWKAIASKQADSPDWLGFSGALYSGLKEALEKGANNELEGAFSGLAKYIYQLSGPLARMVGGAMDLMAQGSALLLPHKMQLGLMSAVARAGSPNMQLIDLSMYTTPKQATRALANQLAYKAGLSSGQGMRSPARSAMTPGIEVDRTTGGKQFKFNMVMLVDTNRIAQWQSFDIGARSMRNARAGEVAAAVSSQEFDSLLRQSIGRLNSLEFKTGVVATIFAGASLGKLYEDYKKSTVNDSAIKGSNFATGVAALAGNAIELSGTAAKSIPWGSQKLAQPLGRLMLNAASRAEVVIAGGKWLGAIGGFVSGVLMVSDGLEDGALNKKYGIAMAGLGLTSILLSGLIIFGVAIPFAILMLILVAIVSVVVGFFKPDEMEKWLDKSVHWGQNKSGEFSSLDEQSNALKAMATTAKGGA